MSDDLKPMREPRRKGPYLKHSDTESPIRDIRREMGLTQHEFWGKIKVSQTLGCNIETGYRRISEEVAFRLKNVHGITVPDDGMVEPEENDE